MTRSPGGIPGVWQFSRVVSPACVPPGTNSVPDRALGSPLAQGATRTTVEDRKQRQDSRSLGCAKGSDCPAVWVASCSMSPFDHATNPRMSIP